MSAPRITARGLGTPRNGMPERKPYVYGATRPAQPEPIAEPSEIVRKLREEIAAKWAESGHCPDCGYPPDSIGHDTLCGGQE